MAFAVTAFLHMLKVTLVMRISDSVFSVLAAHFIRVFKGAQLGLVCANICSIAPLVVARRVILTCTYIDLQCKHI